MPFMLTYANEASVQHNTINYNILYFRRAIKWNFVQYSQHVLAILYIIPNNILILANKYSILVN